MMNYVQKDADNVIDVGGHIPREKVSRSYLVSTYRNLYKFNIFPLIGTIC